MLLSSFYMSGERLFCKTFLLCFFAVKDRTILHIPIFGVILYIFTTEYGEKDAKFERILSTAKPY